MQKVNNFFGGLTITMVLGRSSMSWYRFSFYREATVRERALFPQMTKVEMSCEKNHCEGQIFRRIEKIDTFKCVDAWEKGRSFSCQLNQPNHKKGYEIFFSSVHEVSILENKPVKEIRYLDKNGDKVVDLIAIMVASGKIYASEFIFEEF